MRNVRTSLAVLALLAVGAAGCGDDDERLSKSAFVAAADAACTEAKDRIGENTASIPDDLRDTDAFGPEVSADDLRRLAPFAERHGRIYEDLHAELESLEPPEADQERIEAVLEELDAAAQRFDDAAKAFRQGERLDGESPIFALSGPSRDLAEYGAGNCLHSGN